MTIAPNTQLHVYQRSTRLRKPPLALGRSHSRSSCRPKWKGAYAQISVNVRIEANSLNSYAWQHIFIGTRLASHGYVVAVAEHYADCTWPWDPCDDLLTIMVNRPRDISFVISQLLIKNWTPGELLFHKIDPEKIAASGHSIGGYATYAVTGGDHLVCDALWPAIVGSETLPYPPSTCVATVPDRRIKAMVSLDGSSQMLRFHELARISIPSLIMGETVDQSTGTRNFGRYARPNTNEGLDCTPSRCNRPH